MPGEADQARPGERRYWCRAGQRRDEVIFDAVETRHLSKVMRHRPGDHLWAIDGSGLVLGVELLPGRGAEARGRVLETSPADAAPGPELWLGQALIRPARFEWLLEKAVEIGLAGLMPLITRHANPARQWTATRRDRLERIARSAVAQSLGTRMPVLAAPQELEQLELEQFDRIYLAHGPASEVLPPLSSTGRVLVLVGPEGGFDPAEVADLLTRGALTLGLGARRLRSETAALAALTLARWGAAVPPADRRPG